MEEALLGPSFEKIAAAQPLLICAIIIVIIVAVMVAVGWTIIIVRLLTIVPLFDSRFGFHKNGLIQGTGVLVHALQRDLRPGSSVATMRLIHGKDDAVYILVHLHHIGDLLHATFG